MSAAIEIEIHKLLNEFGDAGLVADELVKRWERNLFTADQQTCLAQFLLNCGFYPTLLNQMRRLIASKRTVPWPQFAEALKRSRVTPNGDELTALMDGLIEQEGFAEILLSQAVDEWDQSFVERRSQLRARKLLNAEEKKALLREKLEFFRNQRMFEEEARVIEELRRTFPDDIDFDQEKEAYEERWAREVIAQSTSVTDVTREAAERAARLSPEQVSIKSRVVERAFALAENEPELAYDLAMMLQFMEFYNDAVGILELAPSSTAKDWFMVELLLKSRQFVRVLEVCDLLETAYAGEPDATFAVIYARARALWGLGQGSMAVDLMRSIVKIRPHYKSAHSFLIDWTGGDL